MKRNSLNSINILESYIKGKDDDQYKILESIYAETAELEFEIDSEDISFPTHISGNLNIAEVLSKNFNTKYNNVKTYYLSKPNDDQLNIHQQNWLVVMKDISNQDKDNFTRVGTGYYNWGLVEGENGLKIQKHRIYIHSMIQIEDDSSSELNRIQSELEYPWTEPTKVINTLAIKPEYHNISDYLKNQI